MKDESVALYFKNASSDKVYNAWLKRSGSLWRVDYSYGRRGSALTSGSKVTGATYNGAKKTYDKLVAEKRSKGYQGTGSSTPVTGTIASGKDSGYRPQLLNEIEENEVEGYIKNPEFCAQEKFDGRNRLLIRDTGGKGHGTNRKGLFVDIPRDVEKELRTLSELSVIAGEAIGDKVMCFDLISMKDEPFQKRDQTLKELLKGKKDLIAVDTAWTETTKRNLYERLKKENAEGIVFKHKDAHYTPGRPASGGAQLKFKFVATASLFVTDRNPGKRSVVMGIYDGTSVETVGSVTVYPNQEIPNIGDVIEVKYLYAYKGGSLFQPVLLGVRDDVTQKECTIDQLKFKQEEETVS